MGLLSSSSSITRYLVQGTFEGSVIKSVLKGLKDNVISEIDGSPMETSVGWTSFENPYLPFFDNSSFQLGAYLVFALRIDKKSISSRTVKKHVSQKIAGIRAEKREKPLSTNDKKQVKEAVINKLYRQTPATPHIYDVVWNYEASTLCFFSASKTANEEFETLFAKSFKLRLVHLFPYTTGDLTAGLSDSKRDTLNRLSPSAFTG